MPSVRIRHWQWSRGGVVVLIAVGTATVPTLGVAICVVSILRVGKVDESGSGVAPVFGAACDLLQGLIVCWRDEFEV